MVECYFLWWFSFVFRYLIYIDVGLPSSLHTAWIFCYCMFLRLKEMSVSFVYTTFCLTGKWQKKYGGSRHGVGGVSLFVGLRGTKEELNLPASQVWAYTRPDLNNLVREFMSRSREDCFKENIPLLFISFPSAKDPTYSERFPGMLVCC